MKNSFHLNTKIIGLLGHPIKHSYSPFVHNIAIQLKKLDYIYLPFDVPPANLKNALKGMIALNIKGFNITLPHKENIISFISNISEEASMVGAVNTVVNDMGKLYGYNTDVHGICESLLPYKEEITGSEVSVVGAGGAARAVIYTLIRYFKPGRINIIDRTEQRADALKVYFRDKMKYDKFRTRELFPPENVELFSASKLIVNATSVGMYPDIDDSITTIESSFCKGQIVFDMVYNPTQTKFLKMASAKGAVPVTGLTMLVKQASKSFELWTGEEFPMDEIQKSLQLFMRD